MKVTTISTSGTNATATNVIIILVWIFMSKSIT